MTADENTGDDRQTVRKPNYAELIETALRDAIDAYGTDDFDVHAGTTMGVAIATVPKGADYPDMLECEIRRAIYSDEPLKHLEAILSKVRETGSRETSPQATPHPLIAIARAAEHALHMLTRREKQRFRIMAGVCIGLVKVFSVPQHVRKRIMDGLQNTDGYQFFESFVAV